MEGKEEIKELRFSVIIGMLEEFPELKERVKQWLEENHERARRDKGDESLRDG